MTPSHGEDAALRVLQDEVDRLRTENEDLLETQRRLESTRQSYSELFDNAPMAWINVDPAGLIQNLNLVAVTLMGVGRAHLVGSPLSAFIHPDDRLCFREHLLSAKNRRDLQRCELRVAFREAGPIPVQLSTRCTDSGDGSLVVALVDLRELHAAEAERRRLAKAEREARAANDAKDTFIAMLSHELRTPLTPVLAAASALGQFQELPSEMRDMLAVIVRNVGMEVQLIDDLLDLTRITHGKMRVEKHPLDMHALARDVLDDLRADAESAGLSLSLELLASRYWVAGDPLRLQQVFNNLLRNAIKFTSAGGQIEIRTWNRDEQLLVEVSDTGQGFDEDTLRKLFQPFEQALQGALGSVKGLGLGLPICRGILQQHEATIGASSGGLGRGARFVIDIGTIEPPTLRPAAPSVPVSEPAKNLRVLLVEDHEDTAEIFARLLRRYGYSVEVASSVSSALAIDATSFDLLLCDVGLSDGSGRDLMRTLRRARPVSGIALSGYGTEDDLRASKEAGFAMHLTKPVDFAELLAAIAKLSSA